VFENRALRRTFGRKRDEITEEWRKLHKEEINDLYPLTQYYSRDDIENNEMGGTCSTYGWRRESYTGFWWGNLRERDHL